MNPLVCKLEVVPYKSWLSDKFFSIKNVSSCLIYTAGHQVPVWILDPAAQVFRVVQTV